jgi:hypothetical protein
MGWALCKSRAMGGEDQRFAGTLVSHSTIVSVEAPVNFDCVPTLGMADVIDGDIVMLAPEESLHHPALFPAYQAETRCSTVTRPAESKRNVASKLQSSHNQKNTVARFGLADRGSCVTSRENGVGSKRNSLPCPIRRNGVEHNGFAHFVTTIFSLRAAAPDQAATFNTILPGL